MMNPANRWFLTSLLLLAPLNAAGAKVTGMGMMLVIDLQKAARPETARNEVAEILMRRLDDSGSEAIAKPSTMNGKDHLIVVVSRTENPEQVLRLVQTPGLMEFRFVRFPGGDGAAREEVLQHFGGQLPADLELLEQAGKKYYAVEKRPLITGADIKTVQSSLGQFGNPVLQLRLTSDAAEVFGKATEANIGSALAIVFDGKVISAPVIRTRLEKDVIVEGAFTEEEARELVMVLRSGPLPAPVKLSNVSYDEPLPPRRYRHYLFGGCALVFLLFIAMLVWLYRRSDPARRARGGN